jgi:SAM-dependent methyltransferase
MTLFGNSLAHKETSMPAMDYSKIAALYDVYARTDIDVAFFIQETRSFTNVLELMSGTGRLSIPLIEAGIPLSCLDSSPEMLMFLQEKLKAKQLNALVYEMDVSALSLPARYDLIIIPFNSIAEISDPKQHGAALKAIHAHLVEGGRLICTLHNPPVRLRGVDGQLRVRGKFTLPNGEGALVLTAFENYDSNTRLVSGAQFYELYDAGGLLFSKRSLDLQFYLHDHDSFEKLAHACGFETYRLYGDYSWSEFDPEKSPLMIWLLTKTGTADAAQKGEA